MAALFVCYGFNLSSEKRKEPGGSSRWGNGRKGAGIVAPRLEFRFRPIRGFINP
jgi:hypothetical protein